MKITDNEIALMNRLHNIDSVVVPAVERSGPIDDEDIAVPAPKRRILMTKKWLADDDVILRKLGIPELGQLSMPVNRKFQAVHGKSTRVLLTVEERIEHRKQNQARFKANHPGLAAKRTAEWRIKNRARWDKSRRELRKLHKSKIAVYISQHGCEISGETNPRRLVLHHIDPSQKAFVVRGNGIRHSWNSILTELMKCAVVSYTYHTVIHMVLRGEPIRRKYCTKKFILFMNRYYPKSRIIISKKDLQ